MFNIVILIGFLVFKVLFKCEFGGLYVMFLFWYGIVFIELGIMLILIGDLVIILILLFLLKVNDLMWMFLSGVIGLMLNLLVIYLDVFVILWWIELCVCLR